ncbi:MAG: M23 family metallopeptidase [Thermovirgaceae bacterium]|nr:M23 family metallopeptidase [Thermovirgaceae bacterium]
MIQLVRISGRLRGILAAVAAAILFFAAAFPPALSSSASLNIVAPRESAVGRPFLVYVSSMSNMTGLTISWGGKMIPVEVRREGDISEGVALLGTDVGNSAPGTKKLEISAGIDGSVETVSREVQVASVEYPVQRLTLPEAMVTPPKVVLERISREREESSSALAAVSPERKWDLPMVRPVPGVTTSPYGFRRILNGQPRSPHRGVDYRAKEGDPVMSCAAGTVLLSADHYYAGECLYVDHGNGVVSVYMHLSSRMVSAGDQVSAGDVIGLAGRTGRVTGPHLHFGLSLQGSMVDPEPLLGK